METEKRDVLLGMLTWWGFHALLIWMGVRHFLARSVDGNFLLSDVFAGLLLAACVLSLLRLTIGRIMLRLIAVFYISQIAIQVWHETFQWGSVTDLAIWAYTLYSFGPSSWRHALYTPLGVFGKMKTEQ
jgi:TRAP-type uncharacterized transport system fused permease subunit